jgi:hypothetical protein
MKKITVPCDFGGGKVPIPMYVGEPHPESHPFRYQAAWLAEDFGGRIPEGVMDNFAKLQKIAAERNDSFEKIVVHALEQPDRQQAPELGAPAADS